MKKKISFVIGIIGAIVIECAIAAAIIISKHPLYYLDYEIRDDYAVVTDCKDNVKKVDIPEKFKGYPVTKIGQGAFKDCNANVINIPDTVEVISDYAFYNCKNLIEINLPDNLKYIYSNVFEDCTKLENIEFPDTLKRIDEEAFLNCDSLEEIIIPDSVENIGYKAFADCISLEKAVLPDNEATILENCVFLNCTYLSEVIIPDKLVNFNASNFKRCENLNSLNIADSNPNFVKYNVAIYTKDYKKLVFYPETAVILDIHPETEIIGEYAVSYNYKLKDIVIPEHIKIIETSAFYNSPNLKTVKFENGAKTINKSAFMYCPQLQEVILPDTIETIGDEAFFVCDNLMKIIIPASVKEIGEYAIALSTEVYDEGETFGLNTIHYNNTIIKGYKNTAAEKYAVENDIEFIALD